MKIDNLMTSPRYRKRKGCIVCRAKCQELDTSGRCSLCAAVKRAQECGITYGKFIAANRRPEPYRGTTENEPKPKGTEIRRRQNPEARICVICGDEFTRPGNRSLCCSEECMKIHRRRMAEKRKELAGA